MSRTSMSSQSPVFVVGYQHTGTTLLQNVLGRAPELFILQGETHFIQDLKPIQQEFPNLHDAATRREFTMYLVKLAHLGIQLGNWYRDNYSLADFNISDERFDEIVLLVDKALSNAPDAEMHTLAFDVVMDQLAIAAGKTRWLEKTPQHVFFLDTIFALWPDARVINLVRDPRATIASRKIRRSEEWMERRLAKNPMGIDVHTNYDPLLDSYVWQTSVQAALDAQKRHGSAMLTVRYEDLVSQPEEEVQRICEFTGLVYDPAMLEIGWINSATHAADKSKQGISKAAVDKWRKVLTPEEVLVCQQALRKEMKQYGYEAVPATFTAVAKSPVVLAKSASNLIRRFWRQPARTQHRRQDASRRIYRRALKSLGIQK